MAFRNEITAGTTLIREAIQSQNFVTGSAGWRIKSDGSAEFNNVVIRGGTVVSGLALYYNGTPAAGNLIMSISATAGTDSFGNAYVEGVGLYGASGQLVAKDAAGDTATLSGALPVSGTLAALPGVAFQPASNTGDPATLGALDPGTHTDFSLLLTSPAPVAGGLPGTDYAQINMVGNYSGPCSIDLAAALVSMTDALDVSGSITAGNEDEGTGNAVFSAVAQVDVAVSFNKTFPSTPRVVATLRGNPTLPAGSSALIIRPFNITTSGCTMRVNDVGGVARTLTHAFDWHAKSA
ncbi:hypothetical protein QBA54_50795 [Streptomyces sp. B21-108]|uniref:phage tail tip fiber protein n=1 Tax=Streptomyces sp. B21-108 TaxID=3039419 RepID=UPI002FF3EC22